MYFTWVCPSCCNHISSVLLLPYHFKCNRKIHVISVITDNKIILFEKLTLKSILQEILMNTVLIVIFYFKKSNLQLIFLRNVFIKINNFI